MSVPPFTHETFASLALFFEPAAEARLIAEMTEALAMNVGAEIFDLLDDRQADEAYQLFESTDPPSDALADSWLEKNAPFYGEVVEYTYDILIGDLVDGIRDFKHWDVNEAVSRIKEV